jgi:hypothetical protein
MAHSINSTVSFQLAGGPDRSGAQVTKVDAYDVINIDVPGSTGAPPVPGTATVPIQPSSGAGKVRFLWLSSSIYNRLLTCAVTGGSTIRLDSPQMFTGESIDVLMGAVPEELTFSNPLVSQASITVIVGRNA